MSYSPSESNIFSRRYELPTCLLEVWTERSPLSDWQAQIVAQNLRFCLQLANSRKVIKGNQQQIANLIEAVTSYCDRWLAQDDFETLDHVIEIPKLSRLKLTTLQLFDLYESIELCANEFVILPNVLLEVRRLNLNWLKIMAGVIAIVGVSIGAIRLISPPFGEQPSYQIASTPNAAPPEQAAAPPAVSSDNKLDKAESSAKVVGSSKSANPATPNSAIAPAPKSAQEINPVAKPRERTDKVAIAPEPINSPIGNVDRYRQGSTAGSTAMNDGMTAAKTAPQRRLELPNKDTLQAPVSAEAAKPAPALSPSTKLSVPAAASRAANSDMATTANIKILQIKSEVPSDITTDLVRYLQSQRITIPTSGTISLDLEINGDRISNISTYSQNSTLKDGNAIAELENIIRKWRSPSSTTGKVNLILQIQN
ncbi:after-VIT domain-containing protein [Pseudanabaena yagii]|uniref:After-VIT domain-containing protein n=1 Tax=Pseudanabaena yagii GIHE-NHR1 TaxID=2722753 RepID=A0ABX1M142_9CYAN|nr:after-VIT domain-containing protein [Pseudanabaena yagii]NMF60911.1 after-VIT domain-containing protein [Pseudanabaena yagii GIHE-NHR1]